MLNRKYNSNNRLKLFLFTQLQNNSGFIYSYTLAMCKQCLTRLGGQDEKDDVVLTVPKSQDEIQGAEKQEESIECTGTTSSRSGELGKVS